MMPPQKIAPALRKMDDHKIAVYRFECIASGKHISPARMWGTPTAIAAIGCSAIEESCRRVHRKLLDGNGFYFEQTDSAFLPVEMPAAPNG